MMGTKEGVKTSKPKFCLKDIENNKHNFQVDASILENFIGHRVLNQVKLAKLAVSLQIAIIFVKVTDIVVTIIELKEVNPVTNMDINKDADDIISQHN